MENCPAPPGDHVFFHDDWANNVTSSETNVLTKFHENWAKNVTSRVFTCFHYIHFEKIAPPTGGHVFSPIWTIFKLFHDDWAKNETNVLTKFHEDCTKNMTSRVFTCFHYIHIEKTALPSGGHFHDDWAKHVTSRVITRKTALPTGGHVFQRTRTTFELNQHIIKTNFLTNLDLNRGIIGTNLLTKFHEDRTRNVASRVFTRKTAPPTGGNVFQRTGPTFELIQHIIKTNILTNFDLNRVIIETNLLAKLHEDRTRNVASRVFTRKTAPPVGHVFQRTGTTFKLNQHIIKTNILTNFENDQGIIWTNLLIKFHKDQTRNVASRVFTYQMWTTDGQTDDRQRSIAKAHLSNQVS
ncbi:hypothetical protein DPMN_032804 [Dreissena polymorpha]|uniref:Uncharacterized protein n=1 Tax=Dreissena polymorpha TaxID=45954 RepID=A0A9D4M4G6_DREPO|nr:hypothetical protein DPMN_032804 [Dreissena polymorpha]